MTMSSWEMRQLKAIEASLASGDPRWAKRFDTSVRRWRRHWFARFTQRQVCWTLVLVAWSCLLFVGLALGATALIAAACAVAVWAPLTALIVTSLRQ
jgi:Protein of unknown function (DUF3040)